MVHALDKTIARYNLSDAIDLILYYNVTWKIYVSEVLWHRLAVPYLFLSRNYVLCTENHGFVYNLDLFSACFSSFNGSEIGNEKLIAILDLQNITYSNVDTRGLITGFQFLQVISLPFRKPVFTRSPFPFKSAQTITIERHYQCCEKKHYKIVQRVEISSLVE